MGQSQVNWEPGGNLVPNLLQKALCLCVLAGDQDRYTTLLRNTTELAEVTQTYYCLPVLLEQDDPALTKKQLNMAQRAVEEFQHGRRNQQLQMWALLKLGIAQHRLGRFADASTTLLKASGAFDLNCSGAAYAYAAITAHRSGQDTAAAEHLANAEALHQQILGGNPERLGRDWHKFAVLEIALREARTTLTALQNGSN
jgi:hypothetical protein